MKSSSMSLQVLLESKEEYTRQFVNLTKSLFMQGVKSIYQNVKEANKVKKMILREFQGALRTVPQWSSHMLEKEEERFISVSGCAWLEELLKAIYVVNVQIMSHIANNRHRREKLKVEVPTLRSFVHKCYIAAARLLWKQPFLLYHAVTNVEYQQNMVKL